MNKSSLSERDICTKANYGNEYPNKIPTPWPPRLGLKPQAQSFKTG